MLISTSLLYSYDVKLNIDQYLSLNYFETILVNIIREKSQLYNEFKIDRRYLSNKIILHLSQISSVHRSIIKELYWTKILTFSKRILCRFAERKIDRFVVNNQLIYAKYELMNTSCTSIKVFYLKDPIKIAVLFG